CTQAEESLRIKQLLGEVVQGPQYAPGCQRPLQVPQGQNGNAYLAGQPGQNRGLALSPGAQGIPPYSGMNGNFHNFQSYDPYSYTGYPSGLDPYSGLNATTLNPAYGYQPRR